MSENVPQLIANFKQCSACHQAIACAVRARLRLVKDHALSGHDVVQQARQK